MKTICTIGAVLVGACISATVTAAAPIGGAIGGRSSEGLVTKTATYVCTRDDRGWHYMRGERRVTCRPVAPRVHFGAGDVRVRAAAGGTAMTVAGMTRARGE